MADAMSTSNLWWHVKTCWREPVIEAASQTKDVHAAWDVLAKVMGVKDGSITAAFREMHGFYPRVSHAFIS